MKEQEILANLHRVIANNTNFTTWTVSTPHIVALVNYAIEEERKACEALYEHEDVQAPVGNSAWGEAYQEGWVAGAKAYREAIRARGANE